MSFCDLSAFAAFYSAVHGPLSLTVCIFGSVANILNIFVLSAKEMRWPTNMILTGLAIADLLVMLDYIPFTYHLYLQDTKWISSYSHRWALHTLFHAIFSQVLHFIACCLTVLLAVWRYITITNTQKSSVWCSMKRTFFMILATYIICPLICAPIFFTATIQKYNQTCEPSGRIVNRVEIQNHTGVLETRTIYLVNAVSGHEVYLYINFIVYSVILKLFPCLFLMWLTYGLIRVLLKTKRRRKLLLKSSAKDVGAEKAMMSKKLDKDRQAERTSVMLVAILLLFLITEMPQAILGLLSVIKGQDFMKQCYAPLGDLMDDLALTNSAINFILYCTMSRQFRATFNVFRLKLLDKRIAFRQTVSNDKNGDEAQTQLSQL